MLKQIGLGFAIAVGIMAASLALFMALEPLLRPAWVFAPGFAVQRLVELTGARPTYRLAMQANFLFWWAAAVLVLEARRRRRAA